MNDEAKIMAAVESGEIFRWLENCGSTALCVQCGGDEWNVMVDPVRAPGLLITEQSVITHENYVPLLAMVCPKCGYIRLHSSLHFLRWQDNGGRTENGRHTDPE